MPTPVTLSGLCGFDRHAACQDRRLYTTTTCACYCPAVHRETHGPPLLVLPATFHPLRGFVSRRRVEELLSTSARRVEAVHSGDGWLAFADVDRDDADLPPNQYAGRVLSALGVDVHRYIAGSAVIAGADAEGVLHDVPQPALLAACQTGALITPRTLGATT